MPVFLESDRRFGSWVSFVARVEGRGVPRCAMKPVDTNNRGRRITLKPLRGGVLALDLNEDEFSCTIWLVYSVWTTQRGMFPGCT
jgi:hypothetical protein